MVQSVYLINFRHVSFLAFSIHSSCWIYFFKSIKKHNRVIFFFLSSTDCIAAISWLIHLVVFGKYNVMVNIKDSNAKCWHQHLQE